MPATTPNLALPYPVPADTVDVPRDVKALADKLDAVAGAPLLSALPATPTDGQEVYYLADPTNGVVWHLRYRAASPSTYKWEFVGGSPLFAADLTAYDDSTPTFVEGAPAIAVPLAGVYRVSVSAQATDTPNTPFIWQLGFTRQGIPLDANNSATLSGGFTGNTAAMGATLAVSAQPLTMPSSGQQIVTVYAVSLFKTIWSRRYMTAQPVSVG